ncbi:MAG: ABC transporter ATP-binding protein [Bacteroidota bacterium]|jgi:iron(III) transport system ATP-binding protein|nr:ABC transporter ATP-binding protein [Bacteroidota bacterium]MEC7850706.1 ABC transporter ATP-binding protein [Bacteroidota bacterium]|tara:strand:- start:357 stop:1322 length:966 start_codon:yes stop_codon:yes gene_type:complete
MYLEVKNLAKFYNSSYPIIKDLTFSVKKGELISFLGESGSGKTTFLKCLAGLEGINAGSISLNSNFLNNEKTFVRPQKRKIGFVFQDYPLFPHLNILDNITFNLERKYKSKLDYILKLTGLQFLVERFPHEISGGEQQRACIARALIREPELLLLDEPFSNLDSTIKESMKEEIFKIVKETNTTTILVTHDINDALNISDRILIFKAGILQQYDDPVKMYCEPANCYCAEVLGDMNKLFHKNETYYIRPEKVNISDKRSKYKVKVEKCFFQGKEYKVKGRINNEIWHFFSTSPIKEESNVYVNFPEKDLIYFDPVCKNFFK